jgi:Flp pilus assembly protein TadD
MGYIEEAVGFFDEALHHGAPEVQMRNNLAALRMEQGRADLALPHVERLVALRPAEARLRFTLGVLHARLGNTAQATEQWQAAAHLDPADRLTREALAAVNSPHVVHP